MKSHAKEDKKRQAHERVSTDFANILSDGGYWSLKVLSRSAKEKDIQNFVEEAQYLAGHGSAFP